MYYLLTFILYINTFNFIANENDNKIIISLTSTLTSIKNTYQIINSIQKQKIKQNLYHIHLVLSLSEFKSLNNLPIEIQQLKIFNNINITFIEENITNLRLILFIMEKYKNNPILIINNKCLLPDGWLDMFIEDHNKYPNDAIAASIQFYFGKNGEIKEFSEGFKGSMFGTFNHVTEMIFNFAIINIDLGGILYPKNYFKNYSIYNKDLFLETSNYSEEFWQSAFIIMEDKILRQSSKIFDYTKYIINNINYEEYYINKKNLLKKEKLSFSNQFPKFNKLLQQRQNKIIVSITSYPNRFVYLPDLIEFIRNQNYIINKIILFLFKEDIKFFDASIKDIQVILTDKDLKPHKKYFYPMQIFRDYAIITLDDDIGYPNDTFESLVNAYIENPNIISGRRSHLMTYKNNGELKKYLQWKFEQKIINNSDFSILLTGCGGSIFPPDILNINNDYIPIINETLTCDDLTLKYYSIKKGIPMKWIVNNYINGINRKLPKINSSRLCIINLVNNDICINKLNIMINKTSLNNLCVPYKNVQTGISIYLFDIHNKNIINNILYFDINAYSYCPIDSNIKINIFFGDYKAYCYFNESKLSFFYENHFENNTGILSCYMNEYSLNLEDYNFPFANSTDNLFVNIYNYRKYLIAIFKDFFCLNRNICILKSILIDQFKERSFPLLINNKNYICDIKKGYELYNNIFPIIKKFKCKLSIPSYNNSRVYISGLPFSKIDKALNKDIIPKEFIIHRIVLDNNKENNLIIIIGKTNENLKSESYNFFVNFMHPKIRLKCNLKPYSKYVQSMIYCINKNEVNSHILIENQIVRCFNNNEELLLINEETLIKINFTKNNYKNITENEAFFIKHNNIKNDFFNLIIYIILIKIIILMKRN